ncbi:MAG: hypothetical protein Ct9H90mP9_2100 [Pseudomonadota bacterium]|nr:MAG: hypothetical protein Ct9H90mP9_2100 [Pseudomonadota bacterium]
MIDGVSGSASRLQDAAKKLLELCDRDYTREEMFLLILNPCFLPVFSEQQEGTKGKTEAITPNKEQWLKWTDELGILFGIAQDSHLEHGYTHFPPPSLSLEPGIVSIVDGAFSGGVPNPFFLCFTLVSKK